VDVIIVFFSVVLFGDEDANFFFLVFSRSLCFFGFQVPGTSSRGNQPYFFLLRGRLRRGLHPLCFFFDGMACESQRASVASLLCGRLFASIIFERRYLCFRDREFFRPRYCFLSPQPEGREFFLTSRLLLNFKSLGQPRPDFFCRCFPLFPTTALLLPFNRTTEVKAPFFFFTRLFGFCIHPLFARVPQHFFLASSFRWRLGLLCPSFSPVTKRYDFFCHRVRLLFFFLRPAVFFDTPESIPLLRAG